jgi:hypothetical protein
MTTKRRRAVADRFKKKGKRTRGSGKISKRSIETVTRMAEALDYRMSGYSYPEIATQMNRPVGTVYGWVEEALRTVYYEKAERVLAIELARLDRMQAPLMARATNGVDDKAIDSLLKIMARRDLYLGLSKPQKVEHTGENGGPIQSRVEIVNAEQARSALAAALAKSGVVAPTAKNPRKAAA